MKYSTIGTCSICGGAVVIPAIVFNIEHAIVPRCQQCGAVIKAKLPVIEMQEEQMLLFEHEDVCEC